MAKVAKYSATWKISPNHSKTEMTLFGRRRPRRDFARFMGRSVRGNDYRQLRFEKDVKGRGVLAVVKFRRLYPHQDSGLSIPYRLRIFKSIANPMAFCGQEDAVSGPKETKKFGKQTTLLRMSPVASWFLSTKLLQTNAQMEDIR